MEGLDELLKLISEKLGVGLDIITNNFPKYMEEFSDYLIVAKIPKCLLLGAVLVVIGLCLVAIIWGESIAKKPILIGVIIFSIILFIFPSISEYAKYKVSPTIYVIEEGMKLLK